MANRRPVVRPKSGEKDSVGTSGSDATNVTTTDPGIGKTPARERSGGPKGRSGPRPAGTSAATKKESTQAAPSSPATTPATPATSGRTRTARLRLVHVDPWSVMKTAFLLSIAIGIISIVAVTIVWGVLGAAGVWDSINSSVQKTVGSDSSTPFDITDYIGTSRVVGFTMVAAVVDVVVLTALATLGAFVYNLAATLLGGVEVTLAEDR